jgi:hypothetical protein
MVALPPGITPKTVTVGIASFFDGTLAEGTATITAPVNVVHTPTNRPIFSSTISQRFVDGIASFNLAPTDAPGLNRVDWTYSLRVVISGALVQPDPIYFTLPAAGPDTIDLDSLVTVPSSAGVPISVNVLTAADFTNPASDVSTALKASYVSAAVQRGGTIPTAMTVPTDIRGLALWLDATQITGVANGGAVASWSDLSGNARHAVQATGANQPTYVTGALNSKPVLRFDGTSDHLVAPYRGEPGTVIVVGKATGTNHRDFCGAKSAEGARVIDGWYFQANEPGAQMRFSRSDLRTTNDTRLLAQLPTNSAYHMQIGTFDYATRTIALYDGGGYGQKQRTTDPAARPIRLSSATAIGAAYVSQAPAHFLQGDIAEVLIYDRRLTDAELNLLGPYLAAKWGVPFAPVVTPPPVSAQYVMASFTYDLARTPFHIYASDDGTNWKHVNGGTPLYGGMYGDARDPSIIRHTDGFYYVAFTHTSAGTTFGLARSADLLVWEWVADIAPNLANVANVWAPEFFVDNDGSVHIIVSISTNAGASFQLYEMKANDATLTSWANPAQITGTGLPATAIDAYVVRQGANYYLYTLGGSAYPTRLISTSLTSGYTVDKSGNWGSWAAPAGGSYEGPSLFEVNGKWRMIADDGQAKYSEAADDTASGPWTAFTPLSFDLPARTMRHGTAIPTERGGNGSPVPRPAASGSTGAAAAALAISSRIYRSGNQVITTAATGETEVDFTTQTWAYGGATSSVALNQVIAPVRGLYLVQGIVRIFGATAGQRVLIPKLNYNPITEFGEEASAGYEGNFSFAAPVVMSANDVITLNIFVGGQAVTIVGTSANTWLSITYQGSVP